MLGRADVACDQHRLASGLHGGFTHVNAASRSLSNNLSRSASGRERNATEPRPVPSPYQAGAFSPLGLSPAAFRPCVLDGGDDPASTKLDRKLARGWRRDGKPTLLQVRFWKVKSDARPY
jgi:hypothetical protein